jgi:transcriptional regulator with XRE-family HTH domain
MPKAQHSTAYRTLPALLRGVRESAGITQRELGQRLKKPQSWIYNCESSNRRVDVSEFVLWCEACDADPLTLFAQVVSRLA